MSAACWPTATAGLLGWLRQYSCEVPPQLGLAVRNHLSVYSQTQRRGLSPRTVIFMQDARQDQKQGEKAENVNPGAAFVGMCRKHENDPVYALDGKEHGEWKEEKVVSIAPEAQKERGRGK